MRLLIILFLCLSASTALAQRHMTTVAVNYADAQKIVEIIKPWLSTESSVSLYQDQLILNVTAEELEKARELIKQLDSPGQQLLVSLRTEGSGSENRRRVDIDGAITTGNISVTTGPDARTTQSKSTVRVNEYRGTSTDNGSTAVRATEGLPAYISTGMSAPVQRYTRGPDGRHYYQESYVDAVTGFYATTWVNDGVVRINIEQSNNQLEGETIATQQLQSQVSGALGQWLAIGAIGNTSDDQNQGIGSRGQSSRTGSTRIFLKVELLD